MLINGDAKRIPLADGSVQCCVTSPPYWNLRDYQTDGQLGLEASPEEYITNMVTVFREVWRVLRNDGTVWLNLGDSYAGSGKGRNTDGSHNEGGIQGTNRGTIEGVLGKSPNGNLKPKDLCMIPARVALALQADGWWLRSDIIWAKPNPMPESITDRPTTAHEHIFLLAKSKSYYYDADAVREPHARLWEANNGGSWAHTANQPVGSKAGHHSGDYPTPNPAGRNRRTVWTIATSPYSGAHFATFPPKLVEPMIKAGTSERGCCSECRVPWRRVVETSGGAIGKAWCDHIDDLKLGNRAVNKAKGGHGYKRETIGWQPSCACSQWINELGPHCGGELSHRPLDTVPCVVLDPFCGSGTVGVVCQQLGRQFVGLDLSWEYLQLARERTGAKALSDWGNRVAMGEADLTGLPLWEYDT